MQPGYPGYTLFKRFDPLIPFIETIGESMKDIVHRCISTEERLEVVEKALQEKDKKIEVMEEELKNYKHITESLQSQIEELKSRLS